jgi:hypothetical protein
VIVLHSDRVIDAVVNGGRRWHFGFPDLLADLPDAYAFSQHDLRFAVAMLVQRTTPVQAALGRPPKEYRMQERTVLELLAQIVTRLGDRTNVAAKRRQLLFRRVSTSLSFWMFLHQMAQNDRLRYDRVGHPGAVRALAEGLYTLAVAVLSRMHVDTLPSAWNRDTVMVVLDEMRKGVKTLSKQGGDPSRTVATVATGGGFGLDMEMTSANWVVRVVHIGIVAGLSWTFGAASLLYMLTVMAFKAGGIAATRVRFYRAIRCIVSAYLPERRTPFLNQAQACELVLQVAEIFYLAIQELPACIDRCKTDALKESKCLAVWKILDKATKILMTVEANVPAMKQAWWKRRNQAADPAATAALTIELEKAVMPSFFREAGHYALALTMTTGNILETVLTALDVMERTWTTYLETGCEQHETRDLFQTIMVFALFDINRDIEVRERKTAVQVCYELLKRGQSDNVRVLAKDKYDSLTAMLITSSTSTSRWMRRRLTLRIRVTSRSRC